MARESVRFPGMDHLQHAGKTGAEQRAVLIGIIRDDPVSMRVLQTLRELDLPDWWIVSGAIYNNVWNHLTKRPLMTGVKDIDVFYFEAGDLSYEAEDVVIRRAAPLFDGLPVPVEIRNQARVHLWFKDHFGRALQPLTSSRNSIDGFASKTHAVAVKLLPDDSLEIYAPFGLEAMFGFRVVPNPVNANQATYEAKGARAKAVWPELVVEPWS